MQPFSPALGKHGWRARVGDLRQLASVRRITLDDGPEQGVRALAFSTGGGLDFWALPGRALDIGPIWWRGLPLAWQAPGGFRSPFLLDADAEGGRGFNRGLSGFMVTCGLDHVRQPAGSQPLHGRFPFTPARVLACGEDWDRPVPILFCEGETVQARYGGEAFRLRRRIEAPVGGCEVSIVDTVENLAAEPHKQALLYHCNLGYPAIADGTTVLLDGRLLAGPLALAQPGPSYAEAYPAENAQATCVVATPLAAGQLRITFAFGAATLPWLQVWQDLRPNACVLGIEPCTSARLENGLSGPEQPLGPGETRQYALRITVDQA